jgi:hypothetical protein
MDLVIGSLQRELWWRLQTGVAILAPEWLGFVYMLHASIADLDCKQQDGRD